MPDAYLVYPSIDGDVLTPEIMGTPRHDQLQGTWADRLIELCGRCCYESVGKGRNSQEYHGHIIDVSHLSTHEHAALTFELSSPSPRLLQKAALVFVNRRGTHVRAVQDGLRFTANLRAVREWFAYPGLPWAGDQEGHLLHRQLGLAVQRIAQAEAPLACNRLLPDDAGTDGLINGARVYLVEPASDDEFHASILLVGSRGLSHEQVRHRTGGISQRSTRYVDESESPWCPHPLIQANTDAMDLFRQCEEFCRRAYDRMVPMLQKERTTDARKQARGAARGVLGNALQTQLIVSPSVRWWKWQLHERLSDFADAEIRLLYGDVFDILKGRFPERFRGWEAREARDGIGRHLTSFGADEAFYAAKRGVAAQK